MKFLKFLLYFSAFCFWCLFLGIIIFFSNVIYTPKNSFFAFTQSEIEKKDLKNEKVISSLNKEEEKIHNAENLTDLLEKGSVENGQRVFRACLLCHSVQKNGLPGVGPNLFGVYGRKPASLMNFHYSKAMRKFSYETPYWNAETLNHYLESPKKIVPGTSMAFFGIKKAKDRADLIVYLKSLKQNP